MYGSPGGYSPYKGSYPSHPVNPGFLSNRWVDNASSNAWLLTPGVVGTGAFYLFNFMSRGASVCCGKEKSKRGMPGAVIFTGISTAGISLYVYNVIVGSNGHLLNVFLPVSGALTVLILYYASIYSWIYRLDPESFSGEKLDGDFTNELVTFIYFSITTFATAGGDIAPVTNTTRILVGLEVLFFIFIFTMGMIFFSSP